MFDFSLRGILISGAATIVTIYVSMMVAGLLGVVYAIKHPDSNLLKGAGYEAMFAAIRKFNKNLEGRIRLAIMFAIATVMGPAIYIMIRLKEAMKTK